MQKAEPQHSQSQNQPVQRQGNGTALESPQSEQIAQLEALTESSSQAGKLAQLAAMANDNPRMAAQRKAIGAIHNSPNVTAQRQQLDSLTGETAQREEAEEPLQAKVSQCEAAPAKPNNTGLPDNLKSGIESLSGISMDNVKVHYNSSQPAQLNALAYAQGTDIHVAPGQEQHLPHEAWHVVQQAQGRVQPTTQMKGGVPVNDDQGLEHEADVMGAKAVSVGVAQEKSMGPDLVDLKANGFGSAMQKEKDQKKPKTLEAALKMEYKSAIAHSTAGDLGSGPASNPFIVTDGELASNHHIYPKGKLKLFSAALSKMQVAIKKLYDNNAIEGKSNPYDFNSVEKRKVNSLFCAAISLADKYGMESDGSQTRMGVKYYWLPGNLFVGVNSGYRTDDPGSNEEVNKPRTMPQDAFDAAKIWGRATVTLASSLGEIDESGFQQSYTEKLRDNLGLKSNLSSAMKITSQKVGVDWVLSNATTASDYLRRWGRAGKQYQINTTGADVFKGFGKKGANSLANQIALSVRRSFKSEDFEELRQSQQAAASLQTLIPAYRKGSSSEPGSPEVTLSAVRDLTCCLEEVAARFNAPNTQAQYQKYRQIIMELREINKKYGDYM